MLTKVNLQIRPILCRSPTQSHRGRQGDWNRPKPRFRRRGERDTSHQW